MSDRHIDSPDKKHPIHNPVVQLHGALHNLSGRRGWFVKTNGSMRMLWNLSSILVCRYLPMIRAASYRVNQILNVISNCQHKLICHQLLFHKIKYEKIRHLTHYDPRIIKFIGLLQNLSGA